MFNKGVIFKRTDAVPDSSVMEIVTLTSLANSFSFSLAWVNNTEGLRMQASRLYIVHKHLCEHTHV